MGYELQIFSKETWPWAFISPTFHQLCAHYWQLFVFTDGEPIGQYSEQASESWNKYIKSYRSGPACRARQLNSTMNIRDIFMSMVLRSSPAMASRKRSVQCSRCKEFAHTIRTCKFNVDTVFDAEGTLIEDCFV